MNENYTIKSSITEETLPWTSYVPMGATKLIIGTFPTEPRKREFDFFYPNRGNPLWALLSNIAGEGFELASNETPVQAVRNRQRVLNHLGVGITDMGHKILRRNRSSADTFIFPLEYTDIFKLLLDNPLLNKLIITSKGLDKNSTEGWLADYFQLNSVAFPSFNRDNNPRRAFFKFNKRDVEIVTVHSPSRQTIGVRYNEKLEMYRSEILN